MLSRRHRSARANSIVTICEHVVCDIHAHVSEKKKKMFPKT